MKQFEGRVAVVTGAANGLGRAIADVAASRGMKLVLGDIDSDALERATGQLQDDGADVLSMVCDVRKCAHVEELADAAMIRFHAVHLLFNNAGVAAAGPVWEHTEADWEWMLGVNLWGAIHGARIFTPLMLGCAARDPAYEGHIVNTAAAPAAAQAMGACDVASDGVRTLTQALRRDLQASGGHGGARIGVSLLQAGWMATGLAQAQRHRPHELHNDKPPTPAQQAAQAALAQAVARAGARPAQVARLAFEAIGEGRYLIDPDAGPG